MATAQARDFVVARREDWRLIGQSHLLALPLSALVFIVLCRAHPSVPFPLVPHFAYWTIAGGLFAWVWPLSFLGVAGMVLAPIGIYRLWTYYRHGGTTALLRAGLRGAWLAQPWHRRVAIAVGFAWLPTWWLVKRGPAPSAAERWLEVVDAPLRRPRAVVWRVALALGISLHHLPVFYAAQAAFCIRAPWTLQMPSWAGPCKVRWGYPPGVRAFGCSERFN